MHIPIIDIVQTRTMRIPNRGVGVSPPVTPIRYRTSLLIVPSTPVIARASRPHVNRSKNAPLRREPFNYLISDL